MSSACPPSLSSTGAKKQARSTTGCGNCKKRKLKCDESAPGCSRCHARGLQCPGYPTKGLKWSSKHEVHKVPSPHASLASGVAARRLVDYVEAQIDSERHAAITPVSDVSHRTTVDLVSDFALDYNIIHPRSFASESFQPNQGRQSDPHGGEPTHEFFEPNHAPASSPFSVRESAVSTVFDGDSCSSSWSPPYDPGDEHQLTRIFSNSTAESLDPQTAISLDLAGSLAPASFQTVGLAPNPLNTSLVHVPTLLTEYYFQKVCRECSTFDSSLNPFRTTISKMRDTSASVNHVIQSMAASKLADDMPSMKLVGIEAQWRALEKVKDECFKATALHTISDEVLYTILLLGMTTSWHVREDLGLEYLTLAERVITAKANASDALTKRNLEFFQKALKYWIMIVSLVSSGGGTLNSDLQHSSIVIPPLPSPAPRAKIMPHPWTGISSDSQHLFGQVLRLIREARCGASKHAASTFSKAGIDAMSSAISSAETLEASCWATSIPSIEEVEDTGDTNTPPIHHVLTAKAYLLAAFLHIYMVFPDVLENRIVHSSRHDSTTQTPKITSFTPDSAHIVSISWLWIERSADDPHDAWLRDIGLRIVECLENIVVQSSTRVVHPALLLSVASSLTLPSRGEGLGGRTSHNSTSSLSQAQLRELDTSKRVSIDATAQRIRECRTFIVSRLEIMQALMRFNAIENILKVIKEVWRRADAGSKDAFWMDVMSELQCETLFG